MISPDSLALSSHTHTHANLSTQPDIIGDLAFGEPFYCLQNAEWHWWLQAVFDIFKAGTMLRAARRFPEPLATLLCLFIPRRLIQTRKEQFAFGVERVDKRLQQTTDRPDFSKLFFLSSATSTPSSACHPFSAALTS